MKIILACLFLVACGSSEDSRPPPPAYEINDEEGDTKTIFDMVEHQGQARLNTEEL
jgi:hypothetical protein